MLPMNKLMEDIQTFMERREEEDEGVPCGSEKVQERREEVILFANEMSDKYEELVSVELVDTLMVSYADSMDKEKDSQSDLLKNIDDGVDLDTEGEDN